MSRITRVAMVFVALFLGSLLGAASLQAGPLAQLPRPPRDAAPSHFPGQSTEVDHQLAQPATPSATTGYGAWSKIVFQSYRDSNWEIYIANGDGTGQTRLTTNAASDTYPRLNRGGTRIVFDSNRTGIYEIYTMNPDSTGLSQVTASAGNNYDPAWSPDGSKIAFESFRDGQAEVYVMNANGTGLIRLTNNPAFDGHPTWSPDGTKIAFTSDRDTSANTGNRVWVMNVDGSSPRQLSTQYYSQNPNWSPDGMRIAYDADATNDGAQEIWLMNADGSGQTFVYNPPSQPPLAYPSLTDAWVRGWSPDGTFLAFTRLTWVYYQGAWYWYTGYLEACNPTSVNDPFAFQLVATAGDDWYPDWQTLDLQSPTSRIDDLPTYSRNPTTVTWTGQDSGGSGLKSYDLQYQIDNNGTWINWLTATVNSSSVFSNTAGHSYRFRSRARDYAGNVGNWNVNSAASTTLYTWAAYGTARDNRDTPVSGAVLSVTPQALVTFPSDSQGRLSSLVATSALTYGLTVQKDGYDSLPATWFNAGVDGNLESVLPPADDMVQNGNFETSNTALTDWGIGGEFTPTVSAINPHSGHSAALLGPSTFEISLTTPITIEGGTYTYPSIAADREGTLHIAYVSLFTSGIYYQARSRDGVWTAPQLLGSYGTWSYGSLPQLVVSPDGDVHVTWYGELGVYYSHRLFNGTWTSPMVINPALTPNSVDYCREQHMVIDSQHGVHVAYWCWRSWQQELYYRHRLPDGTWLANEYLDANREPQLTIGPDDTLYLSIGTSYQERPAGGNWSASMSLPCAFYSQMIVDSAGTLHLTCDGGYANKPRGLPWTARVSLSKLPGAGNMAVSSDGIIYLVNANGLVNEEGTYFRYRRQDGTWTEPETLDADYHTWPVVAVDGNDNLHIVYSNWSNNVYRTNVRAASAANSMLTQTLTIPANASNPTLSFWYRLSGGNPGGFMIDLADALTTTAVFTANQNTDWTHVWVDLSPWSGQAITLAMTARTEVGVAFTRAYVDEVSIGSAYPDLWVNLEPQHRAADVGDQVVYRIRSGNRGGVVGQGVEVTATLPNELLVANIEPPTVTFDGTSVHWSIGDLSAHGSSPDLIITATIAPTATVMTTLSGTVSIGSVPPEIEVTNNHSMATVFVGYQTYLPVMRR